MKAKIKKPMNVPTWLTNNNGRRPIWSERRPSIGPAINWQKAYKETNSPTTAGDAP